MKLRNKKTGAIYSIEDIDLGNNKDGIWLGMTRYKSLAELNEEWEDAPEEPKEYWFISAGGQVDSFNEEYEDEEETEASKEIGNYFESKEEAEKAAEKLKAFKRLKDKGFSFNDWDWKYQNIGYNLDCTAISEEDVIEAEKDLDLLFGGEE